MLSIVVLAGCGYSPPPPTSPQTAATPQPTAPAPTPPPPPPANASLGEIAPVTLITGTTAQVPIKIERGGQTGPVKVEVAGLTPDFTVKPLEIPADKSEGVLELSASPKLGEQETKAALTVSTTLGGKKLDRPLAVTVPKLNLPAFQPAPSVLLTPGGSKTVEVVLDRNGAGGVVDLKVEGGPAKVTVKPGRIDANDNKSKVQISAAADAPDSKDPVTLGVDFLGRKITVQIPVEVDRTPFRVQAQQAIHIRPGEKKRITLPVERRSYQGELKIEPSDLPAGVRVAKVEFSADKRTVALDIVAEENAKENVRTARVTAKGGDAAQSDAMVVRVVREEEGFLPKDIFNDPGMPLLRRGSFGGRLTAKSKKALLEAFGGTEQSEAAVLKGLAWLAKHQQADGHWPLKDYHKVDGCDCHDASEEKVNEDEVAGTALGVLPFLGAGVGVDRCPEEPEELGDYQATVRKAILYLIDKQAKSKDPAVDGRLSGNMYAHAAGTIALCEAYGISSDRQKEKLKLPAQRAIKYIAESQHKDGGWRYGPKQPGDMSAVAWQFLAIRSGQLAGLTIGSDPLIRAERFVDSCAAGPEGKEKSQYCYMPGEGAKTARPSLTAAGLLTREYLGRWKKDNENLAEGCKLIMQNLPPEGGGAIGSIYFYYYATQVLHHMEGADFDLWNLRMREHLIRTQEKAGHKEGSWSPAGSDWGSGGGRIYTTSLALMTLEVYYRHLPMYRTGSAAKKSKTAAEESEE